MAFVPYVVSKDTVTFYLDGVPYSVDASFPGYLGVLDELKKGSPDRERLISLTEPTKAVADAVAKVESADYLPKGVVSVTRSEIRYNGESIHGVLVDRILGLLAEGFDIMPMVRFLENLYTNPADFARDELYLWLETSNLPITEDGHFLAYKNVNGDFTSIHDGRTKNDPGTVVSMPRQNVDPVRDRTCSRGLHFCSKSYLPHFSCGRDTKVILLKINPADVVSIPSDYNNAKGRAWKYEVLQVVDGDPQTKVWPSVVASDGGDAKKQADKVFDVQSDLGKALFAAIRELGITDREDRLDWAFNVLLGTNVEPDSLESFRDLTIVQAEYLLGEARKVKDERDRKSLHLTNALTDQARRNRISTINSLGIEALRREASSAGWTAERGGSAYKGPKAADLKAFLISKVK